MDMCYDGALVMPSNYAVMNEEEMTYVEGGAVLAKVSYKKLTSFLGAVGLSFLSTYANAHSLASLTKKVKSVYSAIKAGLASTGWGVIVAGYLTWKGGQFIDSFCECLDKKKTLIVGLGWTGVYFDAD